MTLPLAAASVRLRGKPGRPKKVRVGHISGTDTSGTRANSGATGGTLAYQATAPRLLDLGAAAAYLAVSPWTVRDLESTGTLRRVRVPLPSGRELRKLLFDKADLDRLIESWKS